MTLDSWGRSSKIGKVPEVLRGVEISLSPPLRIVVIVMVAVVAVAVIVYLDDSVENNDNRYIITSYK